MRPSTWLAAESNVRVYLRPALGGHILAKLSAAEVERAMAKFHREGPPGGPAKPLASITVVHILATLRTALADAKRRRLLEHNVAAEARPPRVTARPIVYLTASEIRQLLDATADEPLGPLYALAVTTGLRRGELLGLRWSDVNNGTLTVRRAVARDSGGGWSAAEPEVGDVERARSCCPRRRWPPLTVSGCDRRAREQPPA